MFNPRLNKYRIEYKQKFISYIKETSLFPLAVLLLLLGIGLCLAGFFSDINFYILGFPITGTVLFVSILNFALNNDWKIAIYPNDTPILFDDPLSANPHIAKLKERVEVPPNKWVKYIGNIK